MGKKGRKKQPEDEVQIVRGRLAEVLNGVRSRTGIQDLGALTDYLNRNLSKSKRFSSETIGRWEKLEQSISKGSERKLAQALGINERDLDQYLKGNLSREDIFQAINATEVPVDEAQLVGEILRLIHKLSPLFLVEVMNKAWNILQERIKAGTVSAEPVSESKTIAELVKLHRVDCVDMFEDIIANHEHRVNELIGGQRPTDEELGLISQVTGVEIGELQDMRKKEFGNGANGTNHQGCYSRH